METLAPLAQATLLAPGSPIQARTRQSAWEKPPTMLPSSQPSSSFASFCLMCSLLSCRLPALRCLCLLITGMRSNVRTVSRSARPTESKLPRLDARSLTSALYPRCLFAGSQLTPESTATKKPTPLQSEGRRASRRVHPQSHSPPPIPSVQADLSLPLIPSSTPISSWPTTWSTRSTCLTSRPPSLCPRPFRQHPPATSPYVAVHGFRVKSGPVQLHSTAKETSTSPWESPELRHVVSMGPPPRRPPPPRPVSPTVPLSVVCPHQVVRNGKQPSLCHFVASDG